jgi:hypothetical protein
MKRFWIMLAVVLTFGFTVLGWIGSRIYQEMSFGQKIETLYGKRTWREHFVTCYHLATS